MNLHRVAAVAIDLRGGPVAVELHAVARADGDVRRGGDEGLLAAVHRVFHAGGERAADVHLHRACGQGLYGERGAVSHLHRDGVVLAVVERHARLLVGVGGGADGGAERHGLVADAGQGHIEFVGGGGGGDGVVAGAVADGEPRGLERRGAVGLVPERELHDGLPVLEVGGGGGRDVAVGHAGHGDGGLGVVAHAVDTRRRAGQRSVLRVVGGAEELQRQLVALGDGARQLALQRGAGAAGLGHERAAEVGAPGHVIDGHSLALGPRGVERLAVERQGAGRGPAVGGVALRGADGHGVHLLRGLHGLLVDDVVIVGTGDECGRCDEQGGQR